MTNDLLDPTNNAQSGDGSAAPAAPDPTTGTGTPADPASQPPATTEAKTDEGPHLLGGDPSKEGKPKGEAKVEAKETKEGEGEFDLKLPEGFEADAESLDAFKAVAKELKLTSEQAQRLIDLQAANAKKELEARQHQWAEQQKTWQQELRQDKEFGGAEFDKNIALANRVLKEFGGDSLIALLQQTGLSNHPEVVKTFIRLGRSHAEDNIAGTSNAAASSQPKTLDERLAGLFNNKKAPGVGAGV